MKCGEPSAPGDAGVDRFVHRLQIFDRSGKGYDWRAAARFLFPINALALYGAVPAAGELT